MKIYLNQLHSQVFGEQFQCFLHTAFRDAVDAGDYRDTEQEHEAALAYMEAEFTTEQRESVARIEQLQEQKRRYAAEYAFYCGVSIAYEQRFTDRRESQYDFAKALDRGLFQLPGMTRHLDYSDWSSKVRAAYEGLDTALDEVGKEHLTSHECAWDERISHAAATGYYAGYRTALAMIEKVAPLTTQRMIGRVLETEYGLGITRPHMQRELLKKREKGA